MTSLLTFTREEKDAGGSKGVDRRTLLKGAAALAGTTALASEASARDYGRMPNRNAIPTPISS